MQARPADARIRASDQRMKLDQTGRSYRPRQLEALGRCDDLVRSGGAKLVQVRDLPVLVPVPAAASHLPYEFVSCIKCGPSSCQARSGSFATCRNRPRGMGVAAGRNHAQSVALLQIDVEQGRPRRLEAIAQASRSASRHGGRSSEHDRRPWLTSGRSATCT